MPGFGPAAESLYVAAKVAKTMLAVAWPFGSPARFADSGGAQTRCAQTLRAFSPVSAALLGHTTRPGETAAKKSAHPLGLTAGVVVYMSAFCQKLG